MRTLWAIHLAMRAAWSVLQSNRARSLLTLAVCGLGTAGLLVAGVLGRANVADLRTRLQTLGSGLIVVSPNKLPPYPGRTRQLEHFISLQPEDVLPLTDRLPGLRAVVPVVARNTTLRRDRSASRVRLIGTTPEYLGVRGFSLARGRFLAATDGAERVIVLGHAVSRELHPQGVRLGDTVALAGNPYEVVGVLHAQGVNFAGEDEDHQVFIPLEAYCRRVANRPWLNHLYLQLAPDADPNRTAARVQVLLRERHNLLRDQVDDTIVRDLADLAAQQEGLLTTAMWAVSATSALLLVLGVVGLATLMVLMVRQRREEIGLRRALGATPWDVGIQFFVEGVVLAVVGIVAGLGLGLGAMALLTRTMPAPVALDLALPLLAGGVSLAVSALACVGPALLAARLEPAAALRS
jgi:putative ABC transport system permease protein